LADAASASFSKIAPQVQKDRARTGPNGRCDHEHRAVYNASEVGHSRSLARMIAPPDAWGGSVCTAQYSTALQKKIRGNTSTNAPWSVPPRPSPQDRRAEPGRMPLRKKVAVWFCGAAN
jgi:hypothetical protein